MTKINELQSKLDLIPEDAELVGITCRLHSMGPCPATNRRRMSYCLYFTLNGVDMKIEGEYLSTQKQEPRPKINVNVDISQQPFNTEAFREQFGSKEAT